MEVRGDKATVEAKLDKLEFFGRLLTGASKPQMGYQLVEFEGKGTRQSI